MAGRDVEERVLVNDVDEVNLAEQNPLLIIMIIIAIIITVIMTVIMIIIMIIIVIIRWTSACASTQREAKQFGARHLFNSNWSEYIIMMRM